MFTSARYRFWAANASFPSLMLSPAFEFVVIFLSWASDVIVTAIIIVHTNVHVHMHCRIRDISWIEWELITSGAQRSRIPDLQPGILNAPSHVLHYLLYSAFVEWLSSMMLSQYGSPLHIALVNLWVYLGLRPSTLILQYSWQESKLIFRFLSFALIKKGHMEILLMLLFSFSSKFSSSTFGLNESK